MNRNDETFDQLKKQAVAAAERAYAPYSQFPVGAAVLGETGRIYAGCNVENASFSLTQCAERSALATAIANGERPGTLQQLLIYTPGQEACAPCGACRQVMHELMADDSRVLSCCDSEQTLSWSPSDYLPDPFVPDVLLK